jgi:hypothetical protein
LIDLDYEKGSIYTTESHNKSGFYSWESQAIGRYIQPGKKFMVLAAGGGREMLPLLQAGVHVDAWECNDKLRECGNHLLEKESIPFRIKAVEPNKFPSIVPDTSYDFCIIGWSAYCHILRKEDRIAFLRGIKKVVKGPVLISFVGKQQNRKLKLLLRNLMTYFPGTTKDISYNLVARPGTVRVGFDKEDIIKEADEAGFMVEVIRNHFPEYPYALIVPKNDTFNCA